MTTNPSPWPAPVKTYEEPLDEPLAIGLPRDPTDNPHEINPATGEPWPIEQGCCSYHYPTGPDGNHQDAGR